MSALEGVRLGLVVLHVLGLAAIVGPAWFQARRATGIDFRLMLGGAIAQLVTGVALVIVRRAEDLTVLGAKMGVKTGVALLVLAAVAVGVGLQRGQSADPARRRALRLLAVVAAAAAVVNVVIAVVWR